MQKIFWRAFEARGSCNCAICIPIRPGITRKVTTLPAKRGIKFGDVVTIVYGTVLGTAAFYDGTSKKRRREKIDTALIDLLLENEAVVRDQEARLKALGYEGSESDSVLSAALSRRNSNRGWINWSTILKRPSLLRFSSSYTRHYSTQSIRDIDELDKYRDWHTEMLTRQEERVMERLNISSKSQEYMDEALFRSKYKRTAKWDIESEARARIIGQSIEQAWEDITHLPEQWDWRIREIGVAQLVLKLLKTYLISVDKDMSDAPSIQITDANGSICYFSLGDVPKIMRLHVQLSERVEHIKQNMQDSEMQELVMPFQCPEFRNYGETRLSYDSDIQEQNNQLIAIFLEADGPRNLISRLCSFLLSQSCGSNVHTLNLLLLHFLDLQWFQACKAVISAMSVMVTNQNEVTDAAKLQYYHQTQQDVNLDTQRGLMLCSDNRTTRTFHQPLRQMENTAPEQISTQTRLRNGIQSTTYTLKAGWTAEAFSIVIIDLLDREQLTEALAEIAIMQFSGLQETSDILDAMLQYSVFKKDWDIAVKCWIRFDDLGYTKSVLTWYWMLQACAVCGQTHSFYKVVTTGVQEGVLSSEIEYSIKAFELSASGQNDLKRKVHALQRMKFRLPIPQLSLRDLVVREDDIIQMRNLDQTMLIVYLQYAKLRQSTSGWFIDHLSYLREAEMDFQRLIESLHPAPEVLQSLRERWTDYNTKVETLTRVRTGSAELRYYAYAESDNGAIANSVGTKLPMISMFYDMWARLDDLFLEIHKEKSFSGQESEISTSNPVSLEQSSSLWSTVGRHQQPQLEYRTASENNTTNKIHNRSESTSLHESRSQLSKYGSAEPHIRAVQEQTPKIRRYWLQEPKSSTTGFTRVRYVGKRYPIITVRSIPSSTESMEDDPQAESVIMQQMDFTDTLSVESIPKSTTPVQSEIEAARSDDMVVPHRARKLLQAAFHEDDIDLDIYTQDHRLAAVA